MNAPTYWVSSALGVDFVISAVRLNLLISGANALLLYAIGRKLWQGQLLALLAAVTPLVVDNSYIVWAAMALEKQLVSMCMMGAIALWLSEHRRRGALAGLSLAAMVWPGPTPHYSSRASSRACSCTWPGAAPARAGPRCVSRSGSVMWLRSDEDYTMGDTRSAGDQRAVFF